MRTLVRVLLAVVGVAVLVAVVGLSWAHVAIRRERAPLPDVEAVLAGAAAEDRPVRLSYINTASQPMPRGAVLEAARDPQPDAPYVMSHPAFVLEWADGRMLLVDTGMPPDEAVAFGAPIQYLMRAAPIEPLGSVAAALGDARGRLAGVIFTHLHSDHVAGLDAVCRAPGPPLPVFMTDAQAERPNYTTRPGLRTVHDAGCTAVVRLQGGPPSPVPGLPGVFVIAAGGHTPGSQLIVAHVGAGATVRTYVLAGDIANHIDGITYDIPKPLWYRLVVVPEDDARLAEVRRLLRELRERPEVSVLVSHDQEHLDRSGISAW